MGSSPLSRDFFLGALASTHTHVFVCVCVCVTSERRQFNEADRFLLLFLRKCLHLCKQATTWLEQRRKRQPILNVFFFLSLSLLVLLLLCLCFNVSRIFPPSTLFPFYFRFFFLVCCCRLLAIHKHQWKKPVCAVGETKIKREEGEKKGR